MEAGDGTKCGMGAMSAVGTSIGGQWSVVSGQWSVVSGQWSVVMETEYSGIDRRHMITLFSFPPGD